VSAVRQQQGGNPAAASQAGFTLLEVMIALAIVAIAFVGLLGLESRTLEASARQQMLSRATMLAVQRLSEIEAAPTQGVLETKGAFEAPFDDFRWQLELIDTPLPQIRRIDLTVLWGEAARNEEVTLTSFVLR